jgi:hypothetical protein
VRAEEHAQPSLVCDLSVLEPGLRAAHIALGTYLLQQAAEERQELVDGYAFRFSAERYDQIVAFVANERRCCPFLRFDLAVEPDGGSLTLRMTGREGVKAVLQAELGA